ncbi:diacylglycerol kinase [Dongshaea marina]|uniref:diacylglycerol kinase n=1 Tax=Dongshaea marina TaxID=2047966 RepID=UPI000D3E69CF|nr:diacylglycerol kinase [Dongshaea marina]
MKPGNTGLIRIIKATGYSLKGFAAAFRHEAAFRQELLMAVILIPLALWLGDSGVERAVLIASVVLVMLVELVNSAIEAVVDRIGSERHELSGRAKDIGSAAVMLALLLMVVCWALILWP